MNYQELLQLRLEGKTRPNTRIQMLYVLQKSNLDDCRHMCELRQSLPGVDSLNIVPLFDYDAEGGAFGHLVPSPKEVQTMLRERDPEIAVSSTAGDIEFYLAWKAAADQWLAPAQSNAFSTDACLVPWFSTHIDAKGSFYPCCYLTNSKLVMGNINQSDFPAIWRGSAYQAFRTQLATERQNVSGCRTCPKNDNGPLGQLQRFSILL